VNILDGIVNIFRFDKTNWKAVALCLVAATVFWFFNALNKEHTATISFPVQFQYDQAGFIPIKSLPKNVLLNISGSGWDLLRKSLGFKVTPLIIDLERPTETAKIAPATILTAAAAQLGQIKINHVASDTLLLSIDNRESKKIKLVVSKNQLQFKKGFGFAGQLVITPDSVLAQGPAGIISKISDSIQLEFPLENISDNVKEETELSYGLDGLVTLVPNTATISFEVSELTEVTRKVKVVVLPSPPYRSQISKDSISVTLLIPVVRKREFAKTVGPFAVIDLQTLEPGVSKIFPNIKGLPSFSRLVLADSITVRKF